MLRKVEQMLGDLFFITKNQVQRPDGHAQHNDDVRQRTYLYIHLIRDNRHSHNQTIANQAALPAQATTPVTGGLVMNRERAQFSHVWAKNQA